MKAGMNSAVQGAVVLAEVGTVRTDADGEVRVIVEDKGNSGGTTQRQEPAGDAFDGGEVVVFRAEL